jgi:glutamine synthetase
MSALADFEAETTLRVWAAFEQEFQIVGAVWPAAPAFSLQALRRADPFGPELIAALEEAGVHPEVFLAEYGRDQFEISCEAAEGVASADRAVAIREIVREIARLNDLKASFAPKTSIDGVGNGVHVHVSLRGPGGEPALYDPTQPGRLSKVGAAFCAGVLQHLPALTALTAPSVASFLRLQPHHWSAAWTWLGERDREASLRICPTVAIGGRDPGAQFNIEYRAADAAACPHMVLAAIVRAGLEGVRAGLPCPPIVDSDPSAMSDRDRSKLDLHRLPETLDAALDALERDKNVNDWFSPAFFNTYLGMKRYERDLLKDLDAAAMLARYVEVY